MRASAIAFVALLVLSIAAAAQPGGEIKVIPDFPGNGDCSQVEQVGAINYVYVVHQAIAQAKGARFKVEHNWTATVLTPEYFVGIVLDPMAIYNGIALEYLGCEPLPFTIARLPFLPVTPTPPCTAEFHVVPDPSEPSGKIVALDCDDNWVEASAGLSWVVVNRDITCECHADPPVDTQRRNWGRIKAMFR
jgi:hypothetical protein